jgi:hypothetical protein
MNDKSERSGSCLCGAVRITVQAAGNSVGVCHCSICRKWGGGPLFAKECGSDAHFDGEENISVYNSSEWAERGFCSRCGTHLFYRLKDEQFFAIPVGLFDNSDDWVFDHQVFIDDKPAFYAFANETKNMTGAEVFAQFGSS